jgi:hypothetical protein
MKAKNSLMTKSDKEEHNIDAAVDDIKKSFYRVQLYETISKYYMGKKSYGWEHRVIKYLEHKLLMTLIADMGWIIKIESITDMEENLPSVKLQSKTRLWVRFIALAFKPFETNDDLYKKVAIMGLDKRFFVEPGRKNQIGADKMVDFIRMETEEAHIEDVNKEIKKTLEKSLAKHIKSYGKNIS